MKVDDELNIDEDVRVLRNPKRNWKYIAFAEATLKALGEILKGIESKDSFHHNHIS